MNQLQRLVTARDQARLELHLAGMEAKDAWARAEPRVDEVLRLASAVSSVSRQAALEILQKVETFRRTLAHRERHPHA